jgi:hypothetical protein
LKDLFSDDLLSSIDGAIERSMTARTFAAGQLISGRFLVERLVGRGNFGFVYRVKDTTSGKTRAVKTFYERLTNHTVAANRLQELGSRRTRLNQPNLVRLLEVGRDGDLIFFVEEFISALTLDRLVSAVAKHAPDQGFPPDQLSELVHQVCSALEGAGNLPHGGLHPQNIFMSKQGVKVADLGVAGAFRPVLADQDFAVMSGKAFWSPEFKKSGMYSPSGDVFALGRLLEYVLTLGAFGHEVKGPHPARLLELARNAAEADADLRPPTVGAFVGAFEAARLSLAERPAREPVAFAAATAEEDRLAAAVETASEALTERVTHGALEEAPAVSLEEAGELPAAKGIAEELHPAERAFFGETAVPTAAAEAVAAIRPEKAKPRPSAMKWLAAAAVLAALVIAGYFQFRGPTTPDENVISLRPTVDPNTFNLEGVTIMPEPGGPSFEDMIGALLSQADVYFKTNRITDPPEDSAFGIYSFVLEMVPSNETALEGVKRVENHYLTLARGLMRTKKYDKAEWSFRKVLYVNADNTEAKKGLEDAARLAGKEPAAVTQVASLEKPGGEAVPPVEPEKGSDAVPIEKPAGPSGEGPLKAITANDIKATINKYMGRVKFCFAKNPEAKGVATVRFVVNPDGKVSDVAMAETTIGNADIEQCLLRRVALMQFQSFEGAPKTVTFPFRFNQ